jgi:hypothetical protein
LKHHTWLKFYFDCFIIYSNLTKQVTPLLAFKELNHFLCVNLSVSILQKIILDFKNPLEVVEDGELEMPTTFQCLYEPKIKISCRKGRIKRTDREQGK